MNMNTRFAVVAAVVIVAGCAASPKQVNRMEEATEISATIVAIDRAQRLVTIKSEDAELVLEVADEIKNLDQVKVGDEVAVTYTEALAWQVRPAGEGGPGVSTGEAIDTAPPGAKPSVLGKRNFQLTTTITAIDLDKGTVTLTGPGGKSRTIKARDPNNLKRVKVGQLVDITYTEALAIAVRSKKSP